jgi:hypothetical protein
VPYLRERLQEDPHVWATALYDEITALWFALSYQSFTRGLRSRSLRPHCEACAGVKGRATIEIEHPAGEEGLCGIPHRISAPGGPGRTHELTKDREHTLTPRARIG